MLKTDLHLHSRFSDGSYTPEEVVQRSVSAGLDVIALTDHFLPPDEALLKSLEKKYNICILGGIECGTRDPDTGLAAHILGYGIADYRPVMELMQPVLDSVDRNSLRQLALLQEMGYPVTEEEARKECSGPALYRQHINYVLYKKGVIPDMFGPWMKSMYKNNGPLEMAYDFPEPVPVIQAIARGGGIPVLAHPGQQQNYCLIPEFVRAGIKGIEIVHPSNAPEDMNYIRLYAEECGLFLTGGSDCHGVLSSSGGQIGDYNMIYEDLSHFPLSTILKGDKYYDTFCTF